MVRPHLRVHADANGLVYGRGRLVADNVGFGKTAVYLGLVDVQANTDCRDCLGLKDEEDIRERLVKHQTHSKHI